MYQISEGRIDPCSLAVDKLQDVSLIIPFSPETGSVLRSSIFVDGSVLMLVAGKHKVARAHM